MLKNEFKQLITTISFIVIRKKFENKLKAENISLSCFIMSKKDFVSAMMSKGFIYFQSKDGVNYTYNLKTGICFKDFDEDDESKNDEIMKLIHYLQEITTEANSRGFSSVAFCKNNIDFFSNSITEHYSDKCKFDIGRYYLDLKKKLDDINIEKHGEQYVFSWIN